MTQEQKDLLLKDLCSRLPYGVKILHQGWNYEWDQERSTLEKVIGIDERFIYTKVIDNNGKEYKSDKHIISLFDDKPYLFPLSSMTERHCYKLASIRSGFQDCWKYIKTPIPLSICNFEQIDWFHKNHFDYRGLIEKGLAIDATGLNIY